MALESYFNLVKCFSCQVCSPHFEIYVCWLHTTYRQSSGTSNKTLVWVRGIAKRNRVKTETKKRCKYRLEIGSCDRSLAMAAVTRMTFECNYISGCHHWMMEGWLPGEAPVWNCEVAATQYSHTATATQRDAQFAIWTQLAPQPAIVHLSPSAKCVTDR